MEEKKNNETERHSSDVQRVDANPPTSRILLDPSTPRIGSIVRVVVVTLILLFVAGYAERIIGSLSYLFFLIVLSVFFAYLIDPLVRIIRRPFKDRNIEWIMPRALAIPLAYIFVFAVLTAASMSITPRVVEQAKELGTSLPAYGQVFSDWARDVNRRFDRLRIPEEVQSEINRRVSDLGTGITSSLGSFVLVSVTYLPWFILVPVLAFFFLKDANQFRLLILRMFPAGRWRYRAEVLLSDVNTTLAAYTRAQLISCLFIGTICTIGFYLLDLRYALLLGILAGIFEFVPLLGPLTIAIISIVTAAITGDGWKAFYVAFFLGVLRIFHDYFSYPRIVRGGIQLHPLAIILSVLAGEQVAGIPGVFLSIPFVAVVTVIYRHVLEHQGRRGLVSGMIEDAEADMIKDKEPVT